jgi:CheY-like chemotaxis protein
MNRSAKKFLNFFTLNFKNKKFDEKYAETTSLLKKKKNIYISLTCLLISLILLIKTFILTSNVDQLFKDEGVIVNSIEKDQIEFYSNFTKVYYNRYVLINETLILSSTLSGSKNSITGNNLTYVPLDKSFPDLLRKYIFTSKIFPMSLITCILFFLIFLSFLFVKREGFRSLLFLCTFFLLGYIFHIISGIFLIFYNYTENLVFFIVTTQLFIKMIIIVLAKVKWTNIFSICLLSIIIEWTSLCFAHQRLYTLLILYLSVNDLIHLFSIIFSYYTEFNNKTNFYLLHQLNFEREYLINFLFNMEEGFFTFSNNKILFMNKSMQNIVNTFAEMMKSLNNNNDKEDLHLTETKNVFIKKPSDNIFYSKDQDKGDTILKNIPDSKFLIEKILENLTDFNKDLPIEILKLLENKNQEKKEINIFNNLLFLMKNRKNNSDNFISLGQIDFEDMSKSIENSVMNKKYSICFRVIEHVENHGEYYLEMMFADISLVTKVERERTINDCRSLYLSKVAHELKNPLTSLVELTENIKDSCRINNKSCPCHTEVITALTDHSKIIFKIMEVFLKDFSVFANLKTRCENWISSCDQNVLIDCASCKHVKLCFRCKVCSNCEEMKKVKIDFYKVIKDTQEIFSQLSFHENKQIKFSKNLEDNLNLNFRNSEQLIPDYKHIKIDPEIFHSIIFNLLYFCYKNTNQGGDINITTNWVDYDKLKISIHDTGNEIEANFLKNLSSKKNVFEDKNNFDKSDKNDKNNFDDKNYNYTNHTPLNLQNDFYENNFSQFNKYFSLFISYTLLKKIQSFLVTETTKFGNKFSFIIKSEGLKSSSTTILAKDSEKFNFNNINNFNNDIPEIVMKYPYLKKQSTFFKKNSQKISTKFLDKDYTCLNNSNLLSQVTAIYNQPLVKFSRSSILDDLHLKLNEKEFLEKSNLNEISICSSNDSEGDIAINFSPRKVLIVDDEKLVRETFKRYFKKINNKFSTKNFEILEAENALAAINIIYQNFTNKHTIDLLISDECMPYMKGSKFIKLISQIYSEANMKKMFIISHTAFDTPELRNSIRENGADLIWNKPVNYDQFEKFIEKF